MEVYHPERFPDVIIDAYCLIFDLPGAVEIPGTMPDDDPIDGEQDTRDGPIVRKNDMLPVIQDEKIRRRTG